MRVIMAAASCAIGLLGCANGPHGEPIDAGLPALGVLAESMSRTFGPALTQEGRKTAETSMRWWREAALRKHTVRRVAAVLRRESLRPVLVYEYGDLGRHSMLALCKRARPACHAVTFGSTEGDWEGEYKPGRRRRIVATRSVHPLLFEVQEGRAARVMSHLPESPEPILEVNSKIDEELRFVSVRQGGDYLAICLLRGVFPSHYDLDIVKPTPGTMPYVNAIEELTALCAERFKEEMPAQYILPDMFPQPSGGLGEWEAPVDWSPKEDIPAGARQTKFRIPADDLLAGGEPRHSHPRQTEPGGDAEAVDSPP